MSLPLRECGLKSIENVVSTLLHEVTPLAGVWIEIQSRGFPPRKRSLSLPLRECGLKYLDGILS